MLHNLLSLIFGALLGEPGHLTLDAGGGGVLFWPPVCARALSAEHTEQPRGIANESYREIEGKKQFARVIRGSPGSASIYIYRTKMRFGRTSMGLDKFLEKYTRVVLSIAGICTVSGFLVWVLLEAYHSIQHLIAGSP